MSRSRPLIVAATLLAGLAAAGAAQARSEVQWSVTVGGPALVLPPVVLPRVVLPVPPLPPVRVAPVVATPRVAYREPTRWDIDGDGIPNRYDHRDTRYAPHGAPRHDRDGDGVPNRRDPFPGQPHSGRGR